MTYATCLRSLIALSLIASSATVLAGEAPKENKFTGQKHHAEPARTIRDTWEPVGVDTDMLQEIQQDPTHPHYLTASVVIDKDGSWSYSGKIEGEPCPGAAANGGTCSVAVVMGLKSASGKYVAFGTASTKSIGKTGYSWNKQGKSKVLADSFEDFAAKGHDWSGSIAAHGHWSDGGIFGELGTIVSDIGKVLGVVTAVIAMF